MTFSVTVRLCGDDGHQDDQDDAGDRCLHGIHDLCNADEGSARYRGKENDSRSWHWAPPIIGWLSERGNEQEKDGRESESERESLCVGQSERGRDGVIIQIAEKFKRSWERSSGCQKRSRISCERGAEKNKEGLDKKEGGNQDGDGCKGKKGW